MPEFKKTIKQIEAIRLISNHKYTLLEGGSRCFVPTQLVVTNKGNKEIKDIIEGDIVKSYNEQEEVFEYKPVTEVHTYKDNRKPTIKITLKNGKIIEGTEDHEIYYEGEWQDLKYVLGDMYGNMGKDS